MSKLVAGVAVATGIPQSRRCRRRKDRHRGSAEHVLRRLSTYREGEPASGTRCEDGDRLLHGQDRDRHL